MRTKTAEPLVLKCSKLALFLSLWLFAGAVESSAATFYVSTAGNNSNAGSASQPWRTIGFADTRVSPGDTVIIRGGTYSEKVVLSKSGTATSRAACRR